MAKATIVVKLASNGGYWSAWWFDGDGKRQRQGIGAKSDMSERQARKRCQQLANELSDTAGKRRGEAPRLVDFVKRCVDARSGLSKGSRYLYDLTGRFLRAYFGDATRIDRITRAGARDWRTALANGEIQPVPVADGKGREWQGARGETTACNNTKYARAMFADAVADDLIPYNPFDRLKVSAPDPEKADWHYIPLSEFESLIEQCASHGWKSMIALCRLAGLRRGEAVRLGWAAVDWDKRLLTVHATKTGRTRKVPIVPRLYEILLAAFGVAQVGQVTVCGLSANNLLRDFDVIRKRAGLAELDEPFQMMRRSRAQDWSGEVPMNTHAEWMGHGIDVSAKFYLTTAPETLAKVTGQSTATTALAPAPQT
jgi:integrase